MVAYRQHLANPKAFVSFYFEERMNMNQTKYTFLLPAYKPDFFEEALRSIKKQTYSDFKVLVSDDCSPHDLKSIFDKVCGDDERFAYRRNEENMGSKSLVSHWNLLVNMCDTEYLILASDDDVYEPTFLEEVDKLARKYPEVDLIRARVKKIEDDKILEEDSLREELEQQFIFLLNTYKLKQIQCIANYMFKTKSLKDIGGFVSLPLAWGSDEATIVSLSKQGIAITGNVLFSFRWSGENLSTNLNPNILKTKIIARKLQFEFYKKYFSKLEQDVAVEQRTELAKIEQIYENKTLESIFYDLPILSFVELLKLRQFLLSTCYFKTYWDSIRLIWFWFKEKFLCVK